MERLRKDLGQLLLGGRQVFLAGNDTLRLQGIQQYVMFKHHFVCKWANTIFFMWTFDFSLEKAEDNMVSPAYTNSRKMIIQSPFSNEPWMTITMGNRSLYGNGLFQMYYWPQIGRLSPGIFTKSHQDVQDCSECFLVCWIACIITLLWVYWWRCVFIEHWHRNIRNISEIWFLSICAFLKKQVYICEVWEGEVYNAPTYRRPQRIYVKSIKYIQYNNNNCYECKAFTYWSVCELLFHCGHFCPDPKWDRNDKQGSQPWSHSNLENHTKNIYVTYHKKTYLR